MLKEKKKNDVSVPLIRYSSTNSMLNKFSVVFWGVKKVKSGVHVALLFPILKYLVKVNWFKTLKFSDSFDLKKEKRKFGTHIGYL